MGIEGAGCRALVLGVGVGDAAPVHAVAANKGMDPRERISEPKPEFGEGKQPLAPRLRTKQAAGIRS